MLKLICRDALVIMAAKSILNIDKVMQEDSRREDTTKKQQEKTEQKQHKMTGHVRARRQRKR